MKKQAQKLALDSMYLFFSAKQRKQMTEEQWNENFQTLYASYLIKLG
jgi:hypothetical protein